MHILQHSINATRFLHFDFPLLLFFCLLDYSHMTTTKFLCFIFLLLPCFLELSICSFFTHANHQILVVLLLGFVWFFSWKPSILKFEDCELQSTRAITFSTHVRLHHIFSTTLRFSFHKHFFFFKLFF